MKKIFLAFAICMVSYVPCVAQFVVNEWISYDGIIKQKKWRIDITTSGASEWYETDAEKTARDSQLTTSGIIHSNNLITADANIVALSTTCFFFNLYDFKMTLTTKSWIADKILLLQKDKSAYEALQVSYPSFAAQLQNRINKLAKQIDLLVNHYQILP